MVMTVQTLMPWRTCTCTIDSTGQYLPGNVCQPRKSHHSLCRRCQATNSAILAYHMQGIITGETHVTCTACAGTLLLEFGTLSRLTGDPVYEAAARHALEQVYGVCPLITLYNVSMTTYVQVQHARDLA